MIPGSVNPLLFASAAGAAANYEIERSLRFNAVDSAYLNRTPASAGNRKTWTWSGWVKRSGLTIGHLFVCDTGTTSDTGYLRLWFNGNQLWIGAYNTTFRATTANFRDPSAWYHVTCAVNTTLSTANDRIKLYVNGSQITAFNTLVNPAQNADTAINAASPHVIGAQLDASVYDDFFSGYLADIHFIDGQALTPSSFGQTDTNGVWQPKAYTGTYGTNGFRLNFSNNSTAAALGTDSSGNGNTWTVNNMSVAPTGALGYYVKDVTGTPFNSTFIALNAFDGSLVTESLAGSGTSMTWTPSPAISASSTIRLYLYKRASGSTLTLNGVSIAAAAGAVIANDSQLVHY
jgi:hypothetical protein